MAGAPSGELFRGPSCCRTFHGFSGFIAQRRPHVVPASFIPHSRNSRLRDPPSRHCPSNTNRPWHSNFLGTFNGTHPRVALRNRANPREPSARLRILRCMWEPFAPRLSDWRATGRRSLNGPPASPDFLEWTETTDV